MAVGAWTLYNEAKKYIGAGSLILSTAKRISLHTSASNANTATLSIFSELTSEVSSGNGYSSSGKALSNVAWTVGASAGQYKFDADDVTWTGTGGSIANIKIAVISNTFTLSSSNTMTIQMPSGGIFTAA